VTQRSVSTLSSNSESARPRVAKETARELSRDGSDGLNSYRKPELVDLAATMDIENRTEMRKDELVSAIMRAARERARKE
jgi:Rho termination factor, N-terminal domain